MSTKETTKQAVASVDLPWRIWWDQDHTQPPSIQTVNGDLVCGMDNWLAKERAAFIVRAVNAHDDLVSALELFVGGTNHGNWYGNKKAIEFGRAAIAKAKGGVK